jgi:precorrin-4/cobalt-precorrin-4 C11-methyltransferase
MCIFLSVSMMEEVAGELMAGGYPEDTPVAVVEKATWPGERIVRGRLADIARRIREAGMKKTAMILVGQALGEADSAESRLYASGFSHGYRRGR